MQQETLTKVIQSAGFRATRQRIALISFLTTAKRPLLIQEIVEGLKKSIDTVTVYRMVDTFKGAGVIREVNLRGGNPRYELNDEHDHHHIVCTDCGQVEDFTDETHERIEKRVLAKSKTFRKITGHSFDLYGLCKTCVK